MHVVCPIDSDSNVYLWKCKSIIHSSKYDHTAESDYSVLCFIEHSPHLTMLQIIAIYWNLYEKLRKVLLDFFLWAYIIGCIWLLKLKFNFSDPFSDGPPAKLNQNPRRKFRCKTGGENSGHIPLMNLVEILHKKLSQPECERRYKKVAYGLVTMPLCSRETSEMSRLSSKIPLPVESMNWVA